MIFSGHYECLVVEGRVRLPRNLYAILLRKCNRKKPFLQIMAVRIDGIQAVGYCAIPIVAEREDGRAPTAMSRHMLAETFCHEEEDLNALSFEEIVEVDTCGAFSLPVALAAQLRHEGEQKVVLLGINRYVELWSPRGSEEVMKWTD